MADQSSSRFAADSIDPTAGWIGQQNVVLYDEIRCLEASYKVVPQFVNAKLMNITSISLWFMVDISKLPWFISQLT